MRGHRARTLGAARARTPGARASLRPRWRSAANARSGRPSLGRHPRTDSADRGHYAQDARVAAGGAAPEGHPLNRLAPRSPATGRHPPRSLSRRAAGSRVRVVLAPVSLGKVEDFGQILPAEPSFRVDAEALSGRMRLRRGRMVPGYEEAGAGLLSADRHVREPGGFFGRVHRWSAT